MEECRAELKRTFLRYADEFIRAIREATLPDIFAHSVVIEDHLNDIAEKLGFRSPIIRVRMELDPNLRDGKTFWSITSLIDPIRQLGWRSVKNIVTYGDGGRKSVQLDPDWKTEDFRTAVILTIHQWKAAVDLIPDEDVDSGPAESVTSQTVISKPRRKRQELLQSALVARHQFEDGEIGNWGPFTSAQLQEDTQASPATVTEFFNKFFRLEDEGATGYDRYQAMCMRKSSDLITILRSFAGELTASSMLQVDDLESAAAGRNSRKAKPINQWDLGD